MLADEIEGFVSGLLGLVGIDADPLSYSLRVKRHKNYRHQIFYWEDGAVYREFVRKEAPDKADREYPDTEREEFSHIHLQRRAFQVGDFDAATARGSVRSRSGRNRARSTVPADAR